MTTRRVQPAAIAAAVVDATGAAKRLEPAQPPRLSKAKLSEVLADLGMMPMGASMSLTNHVTLSAQTPWVDGKGHLNAVYPRTFYTDGSGSIYFLPEPGQPTGRVEIELNGLGLIRIECADGSFYETEISRFDV